MKFQPCKRCGQILPTIYIARISLAAHILHQRNSKKGYRCPIVNPFDLLCIVNSNSKSMDRASATDCHISKYPWANKIACTWIRPLLLTQVHPNTAQSHQCLAARRLILLLQLCGIGLGGCAHGLHRCTAEHPGETETGWPPKMLIEPTEIGGLRGKVIF